MTAIQSIWDTWFNLKHTSDSPTLSRRQQVSWTAFLWMFLVVSMLFINIYAGLIVFCTGLWAVWNPGQRVTVREKKIFLTALGGAVVFSIAQGVAILTNAVGLVVLAYAVYVAIIWRYKP